jgi:hypothetical protein
MTRSEFLASLLGEPWAWDFACHLQRELFGRELPRVAVPGDPSKRWVLELIERHPERAAWRGVPDGQGGLVAAARWRAGAQKSTPETASWSWRVPIMPWPTRKKRSQWSMR